MTKKAWLIQYLRHGSNLVFLLALLVGAALALSTHVLLALLPWAGLGLLLWPLLEYTLHRAVFHLPPARQPWLLRLQERMHYAHHVQPGRLDLLFATLGFSLPTAGLLFALYSLLTQSPLIAAGILAGNAVGLLYYEWCHFVAHIPVVPRTRWGRWMKRYHLWHHFKNDSLWFGVTTPFIDLLFGTYRGESKGVETSLGQHAVPAPMPAER